MACLALPWEEEQGWVGKQSGFTLSWAQLRLPLNEVSSGQLGSGTKGVYLSVFVLLRQLQIPPRPLGLQTRLAD